MEFRVMKNFEYLISEQLEPELLLLSILKVLGVQSLFYWQIR